MTPVATTHAIEELPYALPATHHRHFRSVGKSDADDVPTFAHAYRATREPRGTYRIHALPIFSTTRRVNLATGTDDVFDRDWLDAAADRMRGREREGYRPPVHVDHHAPPGPGAAPHAQREPAGFLASARVEMRTVDGVARPTIVADIIGMPAEVFARVRALRLPYRSVEILDPREPDVASLALLATTVPYFKYPVTAVDLDDSLGNGSEDEDGGVSPRAIFAELDAGARRPVIAFSLLPTTPSTPSAMPDNTLATNTAIAGDADIERFDAHGSSQSAPDDDSDPLATRLDAIDQRLDRLAAVLDALRLAADVDTDTKLTPLGGAAVPAPVVAAAATPDTKDALAHDAAFIDDAIARLRQPMADTLGREYRYQFDEQAIRALAFNARDKPTFFDHLVDAGAIYAVPISPSEADVPRPALDPADATRTDEADRVQRFMKRCRHEYDELPEPLRTHWTREAWVANQLHAAGLTPPE